MRVTHLVGADHQRGAEVVAAALATTLRGTMAGSAHRLVSLVGPAPGVEPLGVDATLVPRARWPTTTARAVRAAAAELRRHPADVVLGHGTHAALVAALARPAGTRVVWQRILHLPDLPPGHPTHLWLRGLARRVDGVVAITPRTADEVRALGFRGPVWHIPNHRPHGPFVGLDRAEANRRLRSELAVPEGPLVGFAGHLVPQKQPVHAVEALHLLGRRGSTAHLVVVGDGPERDRTARRVADLGLDARVTFIGHRTDVPRLLAGLDVLALPSRADSMPGVTIEAQLAGCPVVAYPVDGIGDVVRPGESGIVTTSSDPVALAEGLWQVLATPGRRDAMARAALAHGRHLSTDHRAGLYRQALETVAAVAGGHPRPQRVLHVLPDVGVGGAERAVATFAATCDRTAVQPVLVAVRGARRPRCETVLPELAEAGVPSCDLGVRGRPTRSPLALLQATHRLGRVARELEADVVDAALLEAVLPARLARGSWGRVTHLVNTPWEPVVREATGGRRWRRLVLRTVDRATAGRDHAAVALTDAVAASARRHLGLDGVHVISRGVDLARHHPREGAVDDDTVETDRMEVLTVGRLVPQKGHDVLVRAVAAGRDRGVDLSLTILGEGPEEASLRALIAGLDPCPSRDPEGPRPGGAIRIEGPVADVRPHLARADVVALASRWEGQSNAVLEAMATGLPVVVSDLPVFAEVVAEAGVRVPADDVDAWADALVALAADPARRVTLGRRARERANDRFDARDRTADLVALYRELVGPAPRGPGGPAPRRPGGPARRHAIGTVRR